MHRTIDTHKVNPANDKLTIEVLDIPGAGGANHLYKISNFDLDTNVSAQEKGNSVSICFQNGPINEFGVNGITQEVLIAICIDRLESFQNGNYACKENELALQKLQEAQMWLQKRTRDRMARGVEGTHIK